MLSKLTKIADRKRSRHFSLLLAIIEELIGPLCIAFLKRAVGARFVCTLVQIHMSCVVALSIETKSHPCF